MNRYVVYVWQSNDVGSAFLCDVIGPGGIIESSGISDPCSLPEEIERMTSPLNGAVITYRNGAPNESKLPNDTPLTYKHRRLLERVLEIEFE